MEPNPIYKAIDRYPQKGERVHLKTNQPPAYEGEAVADSDGLMWRVGYDNYRFPIATDDEYRLLHTYEPPRLANYGDLRELRGRGLG